MRSPGPVPLGENLNFVDRQLFEAAGVIETCRNYFREYLGAYDDMQKKCAASDRAYREESQIRLQYTQAYQVLYNYYEKISKDHLEVTNKYRSMEKELKDAQTTILAQESMIQEYERHMASQAFPGPIDGEGDTTEEHVESQAMNLENQKAGMHGALNDATDVIFGLEKRVNDLVTVYHREREGTEPIDLTDSLGQATRVIRKHVNSRKGKEEVSKKHKASTRKSRKRKNLGAEF
jgi:hypothetical protein